MKSALAHVLVGKMVKTLGMVYCFLFPYPHFSLQLWAQSAESSLTQTGLTCAPNENQYVYCLMEWFTRLMPFFSLGVFQILWLVWIPYTVWISYKVWNLSSMIEGALLLMKRTSLLMDPLTPRVKTSHTHRHPLKHHSKEYVYCNLTEWLYQTWEAAERERTRFSDFTSGPTGSGGRLWRRG